MLLFLSDMYKGFDKGDLGLHVEMNDVLRRLMKNESKHTLLHKQVLIDSDSDVLFNINKYSYITQCKEDKTSMWDHERSDLFNLLLRR